MFIPYPRGMISPTCSFPVTESRSSHPIANPKLTKLECNVQMQVIYKGLAFPMMRCIPNSFAESFSIQPELPSGVAFDTKTSVISGVYNGEPTKITYTITASNGVDSTSQTLTIDYRSTISVISS